MWIESKEWKVTDCVQKYRAANSHCLARGELLLVPYTVSSYINHETVMLMLSSLFILLKEPGLKRECFFSCDIICKKGKLKLLLLLPTPVICSRLWLSLPNELGSFWWQWTTNQMLTNCFFFLDISIILKSENEEAILSVL